MPTAMMTRPTSAPSGAGDTAEPTELDLFRRAVVGHDQIAWATLYARYAPLVRHWLGPSGDAGDTDALVNATFARFWQALDPARGACFDTLPAALAYLKLCARSVRLDDRRVTPTAELTGADAALLAVPSPAPDVPDRVAERAEADRLWRAVRTCVPNERERLVLHLSYAAGLAPREICRRHPDHFPTVGEVYRLKRLALDRLRRAPAVRALL